MYRLTGRKAHRRQGEVIRPGDEFEPTDAELKSFGDKLEKVESDDVTDSDVSETADVGEETYTCAGKDGECNRKVDAPGGYCWQHKPDSDSDSDT